jgi:hypothetical protein
VLAVASISNSGTIASIKPAMLKEASCFLLVVQTEDFMAEPPDSLKRQRSGDVVQIEGIALQPGGGSSAHVGDPGSIRPTPSIILFPSEVDVIASHPSRQNALRMGHPHLGPVSEQVKKGWATPPRLR